MIEMIRCEWLKFRTSQLLYFVLFAGIAFPLVNIFFWSRDDVYHETWAEIHSTIDFQMFFFSGVLLFSVIAASVYVKEFTDRTLNTLMTYPLSRRQVYMGKFLFLILLTASVYVLKTVTTFIFGGRLVDEAFAWPYLLDQLQVDAISLVFQIVLLPLYTLLVSIFKNAIVPVVFGLFGAVGNILVFNLDFPLQFYPFFGPLLPLGLMPYDLLSSLAVACLYLAIGLSVNLLYYSRMDITQ
jgi:ABC-type transport system involved in multi-copper enzyme maturation permease subunit